MSDIKSLVVERGMRDTVVHKDGGVSMGPDGVQLYRIRMVKLGMEMEFKGMRLTRKAPSCFTIAKRDYGLKGNRKKVYIAFCEMHGLQPKEV